jgi:predicted dehydrogenase
LTLEPRHDALIRLAIIGTGLAIEKLHWPALQQLQDRFQVTAFANHTRPKAERFAAYAGVPMSAYHQDHHDLLRRDDVDAVLVSLPIPLNLPVARDVLAAGKHLICEKPPGADLAEGRAFVELAAAHPERVVLVAENWFYRDDLRLARSLLDEGRLGRVHLAAWRVVSRLVPRPGEFSSTPWRHRPGYRGGPHLDAGVHHIAQLRLLLGDADRVSAETQHANATHGGPSDLAMTLRFASGAAASYAAAYPDLPLPTEPNALRLYGTEATLTLGRDGLALHHSNGTEETWRLAGSDGGYRNEWQDFADAIQHGAPIVGTAAQSYRTMEVILTALDAAEQGRTLPLDPAWPAPLSPTAVPLWRPTSAPALFAGLPTTVIHETSTPE